MAAASPTPAEIRAARLAAGLTQAQASAVIGCGYRAWMEWEAGNRRMPALSWYVWRHWVSGKSAPPLLLAA